ncbi:hypothetical protein ZWY2020_033609 [Hordeum vulgare]|nr:hypothetical protein ZWY2020_033609 [Hordeum vulgare]
MWHYAGPEDSTRTNVLSVTEEKVASWVLQTTGARENPRGSRRVRAFSTDNPPPNQKWTNWFSPVSNGNPDEEEEEGSQEGSVESGEYVSDSGETEEESGEEEEDDEEQDSARRCELLDQADMNLRFPRPLRHPRVLRLLLLWFRVLEAPRGPGTLLPSPWVSLPRVATSATSPAHREDDPMDADNVVSSQPGAL